MKYLPIKEFLEAGFLQEINRRLLHPCGLALEVIRDEDGEFRFGGVWDSRDDPEGIIFSEPPDWIKRNRVNAAQNVHMTPRRDMGLVDRYLGAGIQPCPEIGE